MLELIVIAIVAFAFFVQSLLGFGGGLVAIPLLSLFLPVSDVVTMMIAYQFSMGLLIFKTAKQTMWQSIIDMLPAMVIGVCVGLFLLVYVPADGLRIILAIYIVIHLLRSNTKIDPLKRFIEVGGKYIAGFLGGILQGTIGSGGPAFILYIKEKAPNSAQFRATVIAILFLSNIPRIAGVLSLDLVTPQIINLALMAYPGFLLALYLGQKFHDQIPQKIFFRGVEVILACAAVSLLVKVAL